MGHGQHPVSPFLNDIFFPFLHGDSTPFNPSTCQETISTALAPAIIIAHPVGPLKGRLVPTCKRNCAIVTRHRVPGVKLGNFYVSTSADQDLVSNVPQCYCLKQL